MRWQPHRFIRLMRSSLEHWQVEIDYGRVAWVTFDKADSNSNTLSSEVLTELGQVLALIESEVSLKGVVFRSAKESGFIMGADVGEFGALETPDEGARAAAFGQNLMRRIAALPCPSVAAINGFALGGGLELALACTYRIAAHGYERTLGLPEVQLGIHPGFGGSVRIVELLGPVAGLDLMLTGRSLSPVEARRLGLVDAIIEASSLERDAVRILHARPRARRAPWYLRVLNAAPLRPLLARKMRSVVARKARREHYPAPFAIVKLWQDHGVHGSGAYAAEVESIGRLLVTPACASLVRLFHLRERLRNLAPKNSSVRAVHVVGAGVMGGDIAAWCALRGLDVSLQDKKEEFIAPALQRADKLFRRRLKAPGAAEAAQRRLRSDVEGDSIPAADLVIEAIIENLEAKQELFRGIEANAAKEAVLATNTSSIRIEDIGAILVDSSRLVGIHFFNPVASLPLVEVIRGERAAEDSINRAMSFVTGIGKLPLPCRSSPGFVVNRVLMPYMLEALRAHEEGTSCETIDDAATRFGMPMGPIELADRVGLDVALHVATILSESFGGTAPESLKAKVDAGELGVKSKVGGFYRYVDGRPQRSRRSEAQDADLEDRLILALANECVACLDEGVVADADLLDAGVVFGTGFAPFTGGPLHYARQRGIDRVTARLDELAERFGERLRPHPGWAGLASDS